MPSTLNVLSAVTLAALLLQVVHGAPVEVDATDSPAGDPSGEEGEDTSDLLSASNVWDMIIGVTDNNKREFEAEFKNQVKYHVLEDYKISSLPESCPYSNLSKEACLHRLVQGLFKYKVLLKLVEKEYPSNSKNITDARYNCDILVSLIKEKMKYPERVTELTSSQEEQLLKELDGPNTFQRRMTARSILLQLRNFLTEGKRAIRRREMTRGSIIKFHV
uniref:interleukin-6-like n=1 Tax=Semicossyphus pulcher TaxID=241346 RepID=UPI0037E92B47